jgi:transcriptional regulator with AAA-type ATPase domain
MPFRLIGEVGGRELVLAVGDGSSVVGSAPSCEVLLDHATVSRHHAELRSRDEGVEVVDLGSKNGTYVGSLRVRRETVTPGQVLRFGQVELRLESVAESDREPALPLQSFDEAAEEVAAGTAASTVNLNPFRKFTLDALRPALGLLARDCRPVEVAQAVGRGLLGALPVSEIEVAFLEGATEGILFRGSQEQGRAGTGCEWLSEREGFRITAIFVSEGVAETFRPLMEAAVQLIGLAGTREPAVGAEEPGAAPPGPAPSSVVPQVQQIYAQAARMAATPVGVLISGETGSGKEVLARFIHRASAHADGPFVALNCAALPRDLLESELFGIEKGVATGVEARPGMFEIADGGTLFLDEIADMALETQARLLRVLQEGEVFRVGSSRPQRVSVRILAATNRDIEELLAAGTFRQDLYFRIATWTVRVPGLRERRDDVPNLAAHFLSREAARAGRRVRGISRGALDALVGFDWPGNVRQLENEMTRAVALIADGGLLETSHLAPDVVAGPAPRPGAGLGERLRSFERREILSALRSCDGDTAAAARALGMPRSTLYRRMKVLEIETAR